MRILSQNRKKEIIESIKSLSSRIDPITNLPITEDSVLNNRQILLILSEAASLLQETLYAKYKPSLVLPKVIESISIESDTRVTISELTLTINNALEQFNCNKTQPRLITSWLEANSLLKTISNSEGYRYKVPTDQGVKLGIQPIKRIGKSNSEYHVNYYNFNACIYIVEHLETILCCSY